MERACPHSSQQAGACKSVSPVQGTKAAGHWEIACYDKQGRLKWIDRFHNLVTNAGLNHILSAVLAAGTQITSWYVGLTNASPVAAAGDTMSSHAGWTENQNYTEATRQAFTAGAVSGQSVDNSAAKATFNINTNSQTIGGAFLTSGSAKGGTAGTLYSVGAFTLGNKSLDNGDKLEVTCTFTQADDGV